MSRKNNKRKKQKLSSGNKRPAEKNVSPNKPSINTDSEFTKAIQYHQSGQLPKAEEIYKKILEFNPNHSDSLHLLGVIAYQVGKHDVATVLIGKAIQHNPSKPIYYNNLGNALKEQGKLVEAITCFKKALELKPDLIEAYNNMGNAFIDQGKSDEAISSYQKALEIKPDYAEAHNNIGTAFRDQGKLAEAISSYQKALEIKPDLAEAYYNLGTAFKIQGKLNEAISCFQKALEIKPDYTEAHNNMGNLLKGQGKLDEAISSYRKALEIKPDYAEIYNNMGSTFQDQGKSNEAISCFQKALEIKPNLSESHYNLGIAFKDQGRLAESISACQKALELKPDLAEAHNNMGSAFIDQGKLNEAIPCFQKALKIKPNLAEAHYNLGAAFKDQGKISEAISCFQKALEVKPDLAKAYSELFHQLQRTCDWQKLDDMTHKLDDLIAKDLSSGTKAIESPFANIMRHVDQSHNLAIAKSWSYEITRAMSTLKINFPFEGRRSHKDKITIGYLSNDFRDHAMSHLMLGLFGLHNRDEFNIFCYSYGEDDRSRYRVQIQQDSDKFIDISNLGHADAARCIYEDRVDILVDLKGYTRGGRMGISALRPAPVQVRYLGLAGTTGADFFDYIVTDRIVTPEEHAQYYSENFVYLPHCYQINDRNQPISNKDCKKADFGLPEGSFVFCSFNQGYKIEPVMFSSWMKILQQVPEGVLLLQHENETTERNLAMEAETRGVGPARLIFTEKLSKTQHLGRLRFMDLALDTRIVNGAITTSDALWAGVPVITLQGSHFASRMSSSILTAIGLPELITHTLDEYESLAVGLAHNADKLQTIKQEIAKNRLKRHLFNTPGSTRNLENAYKEMWKIFVAGESPRQIDVMES